MDAFDLLSGFADAFTVRRTDPGTYVAGKFQEGACHEFDIEASIQPLTGREIMRLEEGDRTRERRKIYTADRLQTKREGKRPRAADVVLIDCEEFEVDSVEAWGEYFKCILTLRDEVAR